jgi:hypothetical protein
MNSTAKEVTIHSSVQSTGYKNHIDHLLLTLNSYSKPVTVMQADKPLTLLTAIPEKDQAGFYYKQETGVLYVNIPCSESDISLSVRYQIIRNEK